MADYQETQLGKETAYADCYDPSLLCPIARVKARQNQFGSTSVRFKGIDLWTAYELSWLNSNGLPQLAVAEFIIPCTSDSIIESKSFKLYLNSYIQTQFATMEAVQHQLTVDLSRAAGSTVEVILYQIAEYNGIKPIAEPQGFCIDNQPVVIEDYAPCANLLAIDRESQAEETLYSHLLKTNCPVTNQPDWASIYISYKGPKMDAEGLLKYIVSFRQHQDFHEQCVEKIFVDISNHCEPQQLTVYARYTRRGGLDINPFRSSHLSMPTYFRQVRQ